MMDDEEIEEEEEEEEEEGEDDSEEEEDSEGEDSESEPEDPPEPAPKRPRKPRQPRGPSLDTRGLVWERGPQEERLKGSSRGWFNMKRWDPRTNAWVKYGLYGAGALGALLLLGKSKGGGTVVGMFLQGSLGAAEQSVFQALMPNTMAKYAPDIFRIANDSGISPAIVFALGYQESRWGTASDCKPQGSGCTGDFGSRNPSTWGSALPPDGLGWGRGIFQIDYGSWSSWLNSNNWQDPYVNGMKAMDILKSNVSAIREKYGDLAQAAIEAAALAAYNAGLSHVYRNLAAGNPPDTGNPNGDYSQQVLAAADQTVAALPQGMTA
jgi:hypothetical protein